MIVLGLDTATAATAAALRLDDESVGEARDDPAGGEHPGHATRLLAMAAELMESAGVGWGELDRIAVGLGPGRFTGLRVGVASARGLAHALSAELVGVSSLEALARGALAGADGCEGGASKAVLALIDARRGEVFASAYACERGAAARELVRPRALAPAALAGVIEEAESAAGREWPWLAVGDGAVRYREVLGELAIKTPPQDSRLHRVQAAMICELGVGGTPAPGLALVVPEYLRRPDAELALKGATAQQR